MLPESVCACLDSLFSLFRCQPSVHFSLPCTRRFQRQQIEEANDIISRKHKESHHIFCPLHQHLNCLFGQQQYMVLKWVPREVHILKPLDRFTVARFPPGLLASARKYQAAPKALPPRAQSQYPSAHRHSFLRLCMSFLAWFLIHILCYLR